MGKPIVYCSTCGSGLREGGSAKERIYRSGEMVYCERCRPADAQAESSISQRGAISQSRLPRMETPKAFPRPQARPRSSAGPILAGAASGLVLLVALVVTLSGRRPQPAAPSPAPAPVTPAAKPAVAPTFGPELARLDQDLRGAVDREDYRGALAALEGARSRRDDANWTTPVDERMRDLNGRVMALFTSLKEEARNDKAKLDALRTRVERWGRRDFLTEIDRLIEAVKPPPPPPVEERPWEAVFDGRTTDFLRASAVKSWVVKEGALVPVEDNAAQSKRDFGDGELRIRFSTGSLDKNIFFCVRQSGGGICALWWEKLRERVRAGQTHEIHFVMRGPEVTATVDGQPVVLSIQGAPKSGALQFNGGPSFRLRSVEFRPLP